MINFSGIILIFARYSPYTLLFSVINEPVTDLTVLDEFSVLFSHPGWRVSSEFRRFYIGISRLCTRFKFKTAPAYHAGYTSLYGNLINCFSKVFPELLFGYSGATWLPNYITSKSNMRITTALGSALYAFSLFQKPSEHILLAIHTPLYLRVVDQYGWFTCYCMGYKYLR